jgi:actin
MGRTQAIVIDNGSSWTKAGFAGDDVPRSVFPTVISPPDHSGEMPGMARKKAYVGVNAQSKCSPSTLRYPIESGVVTNWDYMETLWHYTLYDELRVTPEEHPMLLSEVPLNPAANREKANELMFELFHVPSLYIANQAMLSLCANGRTTGVVLESGDHVTHSVAIYEGHALAHTTQRLPIGGRDVRDYLSMLLVERGHASCSQSSEREFIREMKEKHSYVAFDFEQELRNATSSVEVKKCKSPSGETVSVHTERFRCSEAMFQPALLGLEHAGVHEMLYNSFMKCDVNVRSDLFANVVLSGGNTMFNGIEARIEHDLTMLFSSPKKIKIIAPHERKHAAWIGGSVFASLSPFSSMCITRDDYDEGGASIVHQKCF